ncbi:MAG TPA: NAD(P)H-binding protein [Chthonomonadaceae bacterium]|nr:NAD(P)H-binding protein [Chthonomonadaceae bacterium]
MSIAITTPTGNIGSRLVHLLLDAGTDMTLLVRHPEKLNPEVRSRVTVQQGELQDETFVRQATQGAEALFWVTPADPTTSDLRAWYDRLGQSVAAAVQTNAIPYAVNISSAGAQLPNAGPVSGLGQVERHLDATSANVMHLRPGYFFENFLMQSEALRHQGRIFQPAPGEVPFPLIATRDIADTAARLLQNRNWSGKRVHGLHGPADLTFEEAAHILGEATGRPLQYVPISPEQGRQTFLSMGLGPAFVQGYLDMLASLAQPGAVAEPRTPETTTPTTLYQWASEVLKPLLDNSQ